MKILIIGGVAGGASAATRARRRNSAAEITILEKGDYISFANCGLPYHIGGEIKERSKLLVATPELFEKRFQIKVKTKHEAISIDPIKKTVTVIDHNNSKTHEETYDKLILSTGSKLIKLPIFEENFTNVFSLWTMKDLDSCLEFINKSSPKHISVIGAGFVGLELIEQLAHKGINVSLIEKSPQVLPPLDPEMASFIENELICNNVDVNTNTEVKEITSSGNKVISLILANSKTIETDMVFVGIGVRPQISILENSGIKIGASGGVEVNEFQQTNFKDIYAVGDMSESIYGPTNENVVIPLAGPANKAGRVAGEHATTNKSQTTHSVYGTSIVRVFNKVAGLTGLTQKLCDKKNIEYKSCYISAANHAGYYPGAKELIIKLLYQNNTGKILGAQIIGEDGVDKRIDVISTLLHFNGSVKDLAELDLSYAPPFGSAKDPLHQIAYVALNDLDSFPKTLAPNADLLNFQVIDIRTEAEIQKLPLEGAIYIPLDSKEQSFKDKLLELDKNKETVIACHSGKRAHIVASMCKNLGFTKVYNMTGGMLIRSKFKIDNQL